MELVLQKQKGKAQSAQSHTNGHCVPNKILLFNIKEVQVPGWLVLYSNKGNNRRGHIVFNFKIWF